MLINLLGDADEAATPTPTPGADENDGNEGNEAGATEEAPATETPAEGGDSDESSDSETPAA